MWPLGALVVEERRWRLLLRVAAEERERSAGAQEWDRVTERRKSAQ